MSTGSARANQGGGAHDDGTLTSTDFDVLDRLMGSSSSLIILVVLVIVIISVTILWCDRSGFVSRVTRDRACRTPDVGTFELQRRRASPASR